MSFGGPSYAFPEPEDGEEWRDAPFAGDFYRDRDDVTRGLTLHAADAGFGDSGFYFDGRDGPIDKNPGFETASLYCSHKSGGTSFTEPFQEGDCPPCVPADNFFKLDEATTLHVVRDPRCSYEIGNHLLSFLNQDVVSIITKVNRTKFSLKADVFVDSIMCTVKIRVYTEAHGQFAMEFQRRTGDSIVFHRVFRQASEYLKPRLNMASLAPELHVSSQSSESSVPKGNSGSRVNEAFLAPLLDMALLAGAPVLQSEAAGLLAAMAEDDASFCDAAVCESVSELLQSRAPDVAFPTARLVHHFAQRPDASALLHAHGILAQVRQRVEASESPARVCEQLELGMDAAMRWQHA